MGLVSLAVVPARFGGLSERVLFGTYFAAMVLLMATDLDQRLLPDLITLPMIVIGLGVMVWGGNSLVGGVHQPPLWLDIVGAVLIPGILFAISLPFGAGAFGMGDVKLLVGSGLLLGLTRLGLVVVGAAVLGGVIIFALLVARRITLKSYVPFGPFLIGAIVWIALLPSSS